MPSWTLPLEILEAVTDFARESRTAAMPNYGVLHSMALPHVAGWIDKVTVLSAAREYMPLGLLGGLLPNIPAFTFSIDVDIYPPTYIAAFVQFHGVRRLQLRDMHFPNEIVLWRLVSAFAHVEHLTLHGFRLKARPSTTTARCSQATRLPEGLKTIHLQGVQGVLITFLRNLGLTLPHDKIRNIWFNSQLSRSTFKAFWF
ncbi:hypothetical protein C8Q73DRAFT_662623 [Cubamyces lactineus]|nr:hypothetical protein C8Q73DRAFT_662623 [Cubamyces lactineus]